MQIVSNGDNLHDMSNLVFSEFTGNISKGLRKQDLTIMQIVPSGDNLHDMSNPVFSEKYHQFVVYWISPESSKA